MTLNKSRGTTFVLLLIETVLVQLKGSRVQGHGIYRFALEKNVFPKTKNEGH